MREYPCNENGIPTIDGQVADVEGFKIRTGYTVRVYDTYEEYMAARNAMIYDSMQAQIAALQLNGDPDGLLPQLISELPQYAP